MWQQVRDQRWARVLRLQRRSWWSTLRPPPKDRQSSFLSMLPPLEQNGDLAIIRTPCVWFLDSSPLMQIAVKKVRSKLPAYSPGSGPITATTHILIGSTSTTLSSTLVYW
jgi:hypothetical protein